MDKKLKIISICLVVATIIFAVLSLANVFGDGRAYSVARREEAHANLLDVKEHIAELESYKPIVGSSKVSSSIETMEELREMYGDIMWECQKEIDVYNRNATIFGVMASVSGIASVILLIKGKRKG